MTLSIVGGFVVEAQIDREGRFADGATVSRHALGSKPPAPSTELAPALLSAIVDTHRTRVASAMRGEATLLLKQVDRDIRRELAVSDPVLVSRVAWSMADTAVALREGAHRVRPARPALLPSPIYQRTLPAAYEERAREAATNPGLPGWPVPPRLSERMLRLPINFLWRYPCIPRHEILRYLADLRRDQLAR